MSEPLHAAVILAGGQGLRAGGDKPKQYQLIKGESLLRRSVQTFTRCDKICSLVVVVPVGGMAQAQEALGSLMDCVQLVEGGSTRQQSALMGLRFFQNLSPDYVHIHDAARPLLSNKLLDKIINSLSPQSGIIPALAIADTLKRSNEAGEIIATLDRQGLYSAQTPQSFPFTSILSAHEQACLEGRDNFTDDASIAEYYGLPCTIIEGEVSNIKITKAADLDHANKLLPQANPISFPDLRTGNGYDVHALVAGDGVTLCGIKIPHQATLSGHSDADVALHALTDALLATMGAGDIGTHFPPSDPQWRGAPSHIFVTHALKLVRSHGGRLVNIDITLIVEVPKITPHRDAMVANLAKMLGLQAQRISIKATTNERLGFIGREEGIAAIATANVLYPGDVPA